MSQLVCKDLTIGYEGKIVISNLSFSLDAGDYLCIVGENGSGKSTLMKTILGHKSPIDGQVIFNEGIKQSDFGYLPQQISIMKDFPATVKEVVLSGCLNKCKLRPYYTKEEKALAYTNMTRLSISSIASSCYSELSKGQQQRVLLARALCAMNRILLLDEPVAGLDINTTDSLYEILKEINDDGITIIMISHDMKKSLEYASHILYINNHEAAFFGTKEEYFCKQITTVYHEAMEDRV